MRAEQAIFRLQSISRIADEFGASTRRGDGALRKGSLQAKHAERVALYGPHCAGCLVPLSPPRHRWCEACAKWKPALYFWHRLASLIRTRDANRCTQCSIPENECAFPLEVDHILPLCEGGTNHPGNLRTLCHGCHLTETTKLLLRRMNKEAAP